MFKYFLRLAQLILLAPMVTACVVTPPGTLGDSIPLAQIPGAMQGAVATMPEPTSWIPDTSIAAQAPAGFLSFCIRFADQCEVPQNPSSLLDLNSKNWVLLNQINVRINRSISPESDQTHYDRAEYWTIPTDGKGVCHDYALAKREQLINAGVPNLSLRIAIVGTQSGERHAVLTVSTDHGDYVLDNLTDEIRPWTDADYTWIERQASTSPWQWLEIADRRL